MEISYKKYSEEFRKDWDSFIETSINGNFLHSRSFYDQNDQNVLEDYSIIFYKKNKIIALFPALLIVEDKKRILNSYFRATYGGVIVSDKVGVKEALDIIDLIVQISRNDKINEVIIRNPFRILNKAFVDEIDYALWFHGFSINYREIEVAIKLDLDTSKVRSKYDNGTKYNVKKALSLVSCTESTDYKLFWNILNKNLNDKHDVNPVHSLIDFKKLIELIGNDKIKLFTATYDNNIVCGLVAFVFENVIHAQYIGVDYDFQELRPINALIDYIIEWGCKRDLKYFNLGTANFNNGKGVNEGLFHFKESFGGRGVIRESMSLIIE